jgi:hypothetical protein
VGAKLARVVQVLARDIDMDSMNVCVGLQLRPRDSLFWFKRPALMRMLMHFTLFTVRQATCYRSIPFQSSLFGCKPSRGDSLWGVESSPRPPWACRHFSKGPRALSGTI